MITLHLHNLFMSVYGTNLIKESTFFPLSCVKFIVVLTVVLKTPHLTVDTLN